MDVALQCHRAMQNETFSRIVAQRARMMQRPAFPEGYKVVNTNQLLRTRNDCIGIKTGWTGQAGYCLAAAAQRGARRFIVVVLNSERRFEGRGNSSTGPSTPTWSASWWLVACPSGTLMLSGERPTRCLSRRLRPWSSWTR